MNMPALAPDAFKLLLELETSISQRVDRKLLHLVKLRASQINGCAYCLDMHANEAHRDGETVQRIAVLDGWRESPAFDEKERAALGWAEAITRISEGHAPAAAFEALRRQFSEGEIAYLTLAAVMINAWNRIAIASRTHHKVRMRGDAAEPPRPSSRADAEP
jgi:AhpD family alkylhydroperoxidase